MAIDVARQASLLPLLEEGKPDAAGMMARRVVMLLIVLGALALPVVPATILSADILSLGLVYAIVGLSVNVLIGYAGQVSLGHHAFVGVGAFTSAMMVTDRGMPFTVAVAAAILTGAVSAFLLGLVALRLQGLYLALITLAYGRIAQEVIFGIPVLTGGGAGISAPRPVGFDGDKAFAYLCLMFLAVVLAIDWRLMKSKAGRAILATRDNEIAARSVGINTTMYKLLAFVVSGAIAGLAGSLYAHRALFVVSEPFSFRLGLTFVLMTVVGGLQSRAGIFVGSMFFAIAPLRFGALDVWSDVIGAVLLLIVLILLPGGIGQLLRPLTNWLVGKPFSFRSGHGSRIQQGGAGVRP